MIQFHSLFEGDQLQEFVSPLDSLVLVDFSLGFDLGFDLGIVFEIVFEIVVTVDFESLLSKFVILLMFD